MSDTNFYQILKSSSLNFFLMGSIIGIISFFISSYLLIILLAIFILCFWMFFSFRSYWIQTKTLFNFKQNMIMKGVYSCLFIILFIIFSFLSYPKLQTLNFIIYTIAYITPFFLSLLFICDAICLILLSIIKNKDKKPLKELNLLKEPSFLIVLILSLLVLLPFSTFLIKINFMVIMFLIYTISNFSSSQIIIFNGIALMVFNSVILLIPLFVYILIKKQIMNYYQLYNLLLLLFAGSTILNYSLIIINNIQNNFPFTNNLFVVSSFSLMYFLSVLLVLIIIILYEKIIYKTKKNLNVSPR